MVSFIDRDAGVMLAMNGSQEAFLLDVPVDLLRHIEPPTLSMGIRTPTFVLAPGESQEL